MKTNRLLLPFFANLLFSQPCKSRAKLSNETSDDLSVINASKNQVIATVTFGKRLPGIHAKPESRDSWEIAITRMGKAVYREGPS